MTASSLIQSPRGRATWEPASPTLQSKGSCLCPVLVGGARLAGEEAAGERLKEFRLV